METYKLNYPDLSTFNLEKIIKHYISFGKKEKRELPPPKKITIITPCSRPENIKKIKEKLQFEYIDKWIIVYDGKYVNSIQGFSEPEINEHIFTDPISIKGTAQRNYGLSFVENGFIYFLDDDNIIHPDFYILLHFIEDGKFYTFNQVQKNRLLRGNRIRVQAIDTSMFLIDSTLAKGILWKNNDVHDGEYITEIHNNHRDKLVWINVILSFYNNLT
jgi:hypothetical protein